MDLIDWEFLTAMAGLAVLFTWWTIDAKRHPERWTR